MCAENAGSRMNAVLLYSCENRRFQHTLLVDDAGKIKIHFNAILIEVAKYASHIDKYYMP